MIENQIPKSAVKYPSKGTILLQGQSVTFSADVVELKGVECGTVTGEMHFDIRYGLPGYEEFEVKRGMRFKIVFDPYSCNIVQQEWPWITEE